MALGNYTLERSLTEEALAHFREAGTSGASLAHP
jgi:hypothetical protein